MPLLKSVAAEPSSERAPTLQGTLSIHPNGSLERIAHSAGVPVSSLAKLVVKNSIARLYSAVLQYAALSSPPEPDTHHPLLVDSFEPPHEDSDDEEGDADRSLRYPTSGRIGRGALIAAVHRKMMRGTGLIQRRIAVPQYKYSLGETTVVWPPPPDLQAAALVEEREEKRKRRKVNGKGAVDTSAVDTLKINEMDGAVLNHGDDSLASGGSKTIFLSHYSVGEPQVTACGGMAIYCEILMVSPDGPEVLRRFAEEVIKWASDKEYIDGGGHRFALHRFKMDRHGNGWWHSEGMKRARPASSVILPKGQIDAIMKDVRNFIKPETKKWYIAHGLQHRRAYLFYGPPGTGKTSTIRAIASAFRLNCCFLSMTNSSFSNQLLCDALSEIPSNALIVLEDVDALFNEDRKNNQAASLTFSGLLNAMDGLVSTDGVITVMTSNHIDRLDKALIRGGRVDRRFFFNKPSNEQLKDLFLSFYPDTDEETVANFLDKVIERHEGEEARSIATLQQLFIDQSESSAKECVEYIPKFFETHFPSGTDHKKNHFYT